MDNNLISGTNNGATSLDWPSSFTKIDALIWTATTDGNNAYLVLPAGNDQYNYGFWGEKYAKDSTGPNYVGIRCVKPKD